MPQPGTLWRDPKAQKTWNVMGHATLVDPGNPGLALVLYVEDGYWEHYYAERVGSFVGRCRQIARSGQTP